MKKAIILLVGLALCGALLISADAPPKVHLILWTQEGQTESAFAFVQKLAAEYTLLNPNVTFEVVNKETEILRQDFITQSQAGNPPDLLWTVNDHAGPFTNAGLIQAVDKTFDLKKFADSATAAVELDGAHYGVPISNGNHLMLYYNKDLVKVPPASTKDLIALGPALLKKGITPLVFNQTEPFWFVPWLGAFGGKVFAKDGVTPTLNTDAMAKALAFVQDLKFKHKLLPAESDYATADSMFKEKKAAMIINGDWTLGAYKDAFGAKLGIARIPMVTETKAWPAPYTSGKFFMLPAGLAGDKLKAAVDFIKFATTKANQLALVTYLQRLPALKEALADPLVTKNELLKNSADQMLVGTPMPTVVEMRAVWDAMKPDFNKIMASADAKAADAALSMQKAAVDGIAAMK